MVLAHARDDRPLTTSAIKKWPALLARHQYTATCIDSFGNRIEVPLLQGQ